MDIFKLNGTKLKFKICRNHFLVLENHFVTQHHVFPLGGGWMAIMYAFMLLWFVEFLEV